MQRLTYRRAALVVGTLLAALVVSGLPAWGAPPIRAIPPQRQPIFTPQRAITPNSLVNAAIVNHFQMLPSERNLRASFAGIANNTITPLSGLSPVPPYSPSLGYWQAAYGVPYWAPVSAYSVSAYSMYPYSPYSYPMMNGYGSGYSGGGGGYSGGGSGSSDGATPADYARADQLAGARMERRNLPAGPLSNLMKADGGLDWPLALRILPPAPEATELRRQVESRAAELQSQASGGKVDDRLVRDMNRDLDRLTTLLVEKADRLPVSEQATTEARQFIRKLREAVKSAE